MELRRVFEPLMINRLEIPNRISRSAHGTGYAFNPVDPISNQLVDYHLARAKGGVGLSILEAATTHGSSFISLNATDDLVIAGYRKLMAAVKPYGMRVFQQIWHAGNLLAPRHHWAPPWGVSPVPHPASAVVPTPMTKAQIDELVASFAQAGRRIREGGLDGIQIHAAHGYLIMQFLSSVSNRREDEYGGPLENRMRFLREVLVAIRKEVGDDFPLGIRCAASLVDGGITEEELGLMAQSLRADGLIDFLDVSWTDYFKQEIVGSMDRPVGYQLPSSSIVTGYVPGLPRIVIGRFRTLEDAEQVLRDGVADMVHMTRAHIADPDIVRKTRAGTPELVRPCIGCNQACWHSTSSGFPLACTVNPVVGSEAVLSEDLLTKAAVPAKVLVIGGGPAGMEAARVAALGGHRVTLVEASGDLGGQVAIARRAPSLHTIGDIATWLEQEIFRLGVEVRLGSYFDADDVVAEDPDLVVIATGAMPRYDGRQIANPNVPVPGFDKPHVHAPYDLIANPPANLGSSAVVFDDVGHYEALATTDFLLDRGLSVTFVTGFPTAGRLVDQVSRVDTAFERFARKGSFTLFTRTRLERIEDRACAILPRYRSEPLTVPADTVVFISPKVGSHELFEELERRGFTANRQVSMVGDALAPRDLQFAIGEAHRTVRQWHAGLRVRATEPA
jgi:2,4-dienoyl-CoA reductase-like NADH-dependent reductase (Old Yellow Enzyme family)